MAEVFRRDAGGLGGGGGRLESPLLRNSNVMFVGGGESRLVLVLFEYTLRVRLFEIRLGKGEGGRSVRSNLFGVFC